MGKQQTYVVMEHSKKEETKTPVTEAKPCDSFLRFIYLFKEGKIAKKEAYDNLFECLQKTDVVNSQHLLSALCVAFNNPLLLNSCDYQEIKKTTISNLEKSKNILFYKSKHNVEKLRISLPDPDIDKIILKLQQKANSTD